MLSVFAQSIDEEERVHVGEGSGNAITDDEDMEVSRLITFSFTRNYRGLTFLMHRYQTGPPGLLAFPKIVCIVLTPNKAGLAHDATPNGHLPLTYNAACAISTQLN